MLLAHLKTSRFLLSVNGKTSKKNMGETVFHAFLSSFTDYGQKYDAASLGVPENVASFLSVKGIA